MIFTTKRRSFLTGSIATSAAVLLPLTAKAEAEDKIQWSKTYDVVVVGSGGAQVRRTILIKNLNNICENF